MRSRLAGSLTLVTLWLLGEWRLLDRAYDRDLAYFSDGPVSHHFFAAVILSTALLTTVTAAVWAVSGAVLRRFLPGRADRVAGLGLLAATCLAVWHGGARAAQSSPFDGGWAVPALLVVTVVVSVATGLLRLAAVVRRALVAGSMAFPVFVAFTAWGAVTAPPATAWPDLVSRPPARPSQVRTRLVWVIFDEWDVAISDERRPPGLELPAIDRLRAEAFVASQVQAPGAWTLDALPALWLGRPLAAVHPVGPGRVRVEEHDGVSAALDGPAGTVFDDLQRLGARISLAGWHHDLCRLFGEVASACVAPVGGDVRPALRRARFSRDQGVLLTTMSMVAWHARHPLPLPRLRPLASEAMPEDEELRWIEGEHRRVFDAVHGAVMRDASRPDIDVVFAHYPIPHLPALDATNPSDGRASWTAAAYVANLRRMDDAFGEIRASLERTGLWAGTTVLVSSDHGLRPEIWAHYPRRAPDVRRLAGDVPSERVPFILKVAHVRSGLVYPHPFSATVSRQLVVDLVAGRIADLNALAAWLDRRPDTPRHD